MNKKEVLLGNAPDDDGWQFFYTFYYDHVQPKPGLRALLRWYFLPRTIEEWNKGAIYRLLGVAAFGRVIPTGGISIRRITGKKMERYVLQNTHMASARKYFFRTCAFEAAHIIVFLTVSIAVIICIMLGRISLAIGGMTLNIIINAYPIMLQRYNRIRILSLLERRPHTWATKQ